jgi:hypothetical protein
MLRVVLDMFVGLYVVHELRDDCGQLLGLVYCDVLFQNVFVGVDGSVRIIDFGVVRVIVRFISIGYGKLKGKFVYMVFE